MRVSGAATSTTHHCLQGGKAQRRGGAGRIDPISENGRQHQTGNMALISDWEGCCLWEWILYGHTMGLPALEAEVFYFYF